MCIHALPFCHEQVSVSKRLHGYPQAPEHIGEHLKTRRLDLGLLQQDAAEQLGVSVFTVINWETGETQPQVERGPGIIEFLGYDPMPGATSFCHEVWKLRWRTGCTQRELARSLEVNETTIRDWERGEHRPSERLRRRFERLVEVESGPRY